MSGWSPKRASASLTSWPPSSSSHLAPKILARTRPLAGDHRTAASGIGNGVLSLRRGRSVVPRAWRLPLSMRLGFWTGWGWTRSQSSSLRQLHLQSLPGNHKLKQFSQSCSMISLCKELGDTYAHVLQEWLQRPERPRLWSTSDNSDAHILMTSLGSIRGCEDRRRRLGLQGSAMSETMGRTKTKGLGVQIWQHRLRGRVYKISKFLC